MSSSDELSTNRQRNPHRTCRTDSEASTKLNKPVGGKKASIPQTKKNTVPQDRILKKTRTTGSKKGKVQSTNQIAPRKSTRQVTNINKSVSEESHGPEQVVPKTYPTPKCQNDELFEKKIAKLDEVDNSCPERQLCSQKTKRTHYRNSKRTPNHQSASGLHTCTTLSPPHHKEASSCHTNKPHTLKQDRLQSALLSSTSNSDLEHLEKRPPAGDTPSTPQRLRGRLKGRKNQKVKEGQSASQQVKRSRKCAVVPVESHTPRWGGDQSTSNAVSKTLSPKTSENNDASHSQPDVRKSSLEKRPPAGDTPSTPPRPRGRQKGRKNKKVNEGPSASSRGKRNKKCAVFPVESHTPRWDGDQSSTLLSSTPNSVSKTLSPKTAENNDAPHSQPYARKSSLEKRPSADDAPLTPQRSRGRPKGSKNKKGQKEPSASPPIKCSSKCVVFPVKPHQKQDGVWSSSLLSFTLNSGIQSHCRPNGRKSRLEKRPLSDASPSTLQRPRGRPKGSKNQQVKRTNKRAVKCHSPKRGKLHSNPLLSSTPNSDLQPLSPKTARNSQWDVRKCRLEKQSPADASPSTPRRPRGRPKGCKNKIVEEGSGDSPPVKRSRKNVVPSPEEQILRRTFSENQEAELELDQTMSSDLSIELSLQEEPHPLKRSLFMQEEEDYHDDDDDDEEELPSFLGQDSKKPSSISEGLFVWCKMRKYPFWPAVVKSVNRKCKKASIAFIDCDLSDQKRAKKGLTVSLRTLKPIDCEDNDKLMEMAKEKYGSAITWSLELISDYRIRIGCGSFSGTFIEYCAADISCPVRRKYSEGKSMLTFPSQEILGVQYEISENNTDDIVEDQDELLSKKVLPDRTKAARTRANQQLVDFIIRGKVKNHLLAIIRQSSHWLQALQKPFRARVCPLVYLEDEEQVDKVFKYLKELCETAPQINACLENVQVDQIRLILDVLLPKAIIYAIAGVHNLSLEKAKEKYHKGPCFSNRERQEFDMRIEEQMKLKEITERHRQ